MASDDGAVDETGSWGEVVPLRRPSPEAGFREVVGEVLREERHRQGRTLADVAQAAAVSLPYLSEVERGQKDASSDVLRAMYEALGLGLADVLERATERLRVGSQRPGRFQLLAA